MEEENTFLDDLESALDIKREDLEARCITAIKESFRKYHQSFKNYYDLLVRKSLIHEDPYKFEQKISCLEIPAKGPVTDSEKTDEMGMRLSAFEGQLDFLNNYFQFRTDEMDLQQIKLLAGLSQYVLWDRMSPGSSSLNTRILSEISDRVKQGSDSLSAGILTDAENQMAAASRTIMAALKEVMIYQKQRYKVELRKKTLPAAKISPEMVQKNRDTAVQRIKRAFTGTISGIPYFPELVNEVLDEDYSAEGESLRQEILSQLTVEKKEKVKKPSDDYRSILMEAVKALGTAGAPLQTAGSKLNDNLILLQSKKKSFSERFTEWLQKIVQKTEESTVYEVEYFDEKTSASKILRLDMKKFIEKTLTQGKLLISLSNRMSTRFQKLENADESAVYDFLEKQIMETQGIFHTLSAVDTFFKTEAPREQRKQIKGIKLEITGIKNNLLKANQKRYEYVSRKEEMEQLKKLGISVESD